MARFSERRGHLPPEPPISVREDAPHDLRGLIVDYAYEAGLRPGRLRSIVCEILMTRPDPSNWSEFPNVDGEVRGHLDSCPWYHVYDTAEAVHEALDDRDPFGSAGPDGATVFADKLNRLFRMKGIGWKLVDGEVQVRGEEAFEQAVHGSKKDLEATGRATAASEIHKALLDLSARPTADVTGAIQHAMAALECALREVTGDQRGTLGQLVARHRQRFPAPLDQALEKLWGFASEYGRHVREGRVPSHEDAIFVVHVAAATARYLVAQAGSPNEDEW